MPPATDATEDPPAPTTFHPIGQYELPKMPTVHALRRYATLVLKKFGQADEGPMLSNDRLQRATPERLDDIVGPPAFGSLLDELDHTLGDWCAEAQPAAWLQLVVLPPGDRNGLMTAWAERHGHSLLPAPSRAQLLAGQPNVLPDLEGDGVLVLPELERWFLRHRNALQALRTLLIGIGQLERHCVIGCNSWAWAYLSRALAVDRVLPTAMTFKAFDADRLRDWFSRLAFDERTPAMTFRLAESGRNVLAGNGDGKGKENEEGSGKAGGNSDEEEQDDYLKRLAARSFGIPWVAWHLWRQSLRTRLESDEVSEKVTDDVKDATDGDEHTLWVTGFQELTLPQRHLDDALLVLHALLLHGELSGAELRAVLPNVGEVDTVPALMHAGFVARDGDDFHVRPAAYPQARQVLASAGFPLDRL